MYTTASHISEKIDKYYDLELVGVKNNSQL